MAYADYIHCESCDCKLIYDGEGAVRDEIEARFGDKKIQFLCPDCREKQPEVSVLVEALERIADTEPDDLQTFHDIAERALAKWEGKQ